MPDISFLFHSVITTACSQISWQGVCCFTAVFPSTNCPLATFKKTVTTHRWDRVLLVMARCVPKQNGQKYLKITLMQNLKPSNHLTGFEVNYFNSYYWMFKDMLQLQYHRQQHPVYN